MASEKITAWAAGGAFFSSGGGAAFGAGGGAAPPPPWHALARPCSHAFVFSGSMPATIFCGLIVIGPTTFVTSSITFVR